METINSILIPYLILIFFSLAVLSHSANFKGGSQGYGVILNLVSILSVIGILTILITIAIHEKWYIPILLALGGLIIAGLVHTILIRILGGSVQFLFSLLGIVAVPWTLFLILNRILF